MILKVRYSKIWVLCAAVLAAAIIITAIFQNTSGGLGGSGTSGGGSAYSALSKSTSAAKSTLGDIRGVWVPYMSLETAEHTEGSFKENFSNIIKTAKKHKMNALIVHIRPFSDALYRSEIYPSSHIVTGTQGKALTFDPLEYMIEQTHKSNMKFHAWINPYRISTSDTPKELDENGVTSKLEDDEILEYDGGKYIDPSSEKGRELIISGVKEVVKNYDVDGIQFDDYFYPSAETALDLDSYNSYKEELDRECIPLTQYDWRKSNVNMLISSVYSAVKSIKSDVLFGISPQGNINNCLSIGADIYTWCNTAGYIDYICPQIYVNFEHSALPFDTMLKQWQEAAQNSQAELCIGLALYKAGSDEDDGTWQRSNDILKKEIEYCKEQSINSFMIYDIDYFTAEQTAQEVKNVMTVL